MTWTLFPKERAVPIDDSAPFVIEYTNRVPMADAGRPRKVVAKGTAAVRVTQAAIRDAHGVVLRVRRARWYE